MIKSMTGFASATGAHDVYSWSWELRSVNGKGLDLRLRVPDWIDGLEVDLRKSLAAVAARGNVTLSLRVMREDSTGQLSVNADMLASILTAMAEIEEQAMDRGVSLAPSKASDIAAMRGVLDQTTADQDTKPLAAALIAQSATVIQSFDKMRQSEGAALDAVMHAQLSEIETLTAEAATIALARLPEVTANLRRNIANVMDNVDGVDEQRIAQELALLAVKSDVTEEIDRLGAHVTAARDLLAAGGSVGRKLDFLMQEFNRESNTLASKSISADVTAAAVELKVLIEQMREQIQNVE